MNGSEMLTVVCALLHDKDGRVLAAQRPAAKSLGLQWEFPGGKVEPGESAEAALIRELHEELGIRVRVGTPLRVVEHLYPEFSIRLIPFICTIESGTPEPHEHAALRWIRPDEANELSWAAADLPIVQEWRDRSAGSGAAGPP